MRNTRWRVYINPFDNTGAYTGFVDVTDYVDFSQIGTIDSALDNTDYNLGIFRNSNFSITFRNDSGLFSDVGQPMSMFKYTRTNSLLKITYCANAAPVVCGFFKAGNTVLASEIQVFKGQISDKDLELDALTRELTFTVLGLENILTQAAIDQDFLTATSIALAFTTNFASNPSQLILGALGSIVPIIPVNAPVLLIPVGASVVPSPFKANTKYYVQTSADRGAGFVPFVYLSQSQGSFSNDPTQPSTLADPIVMTDDGTGTFILQTYIQGAKDAIYNILNQAPITDFLTVDFANINPNAIIGEFYDMSGTLGQNVWDALQDMLLATNSVFYVRNDTIYVAPRTPNAEVDYAFYGQASKLGVENIQELESIKNGLARTFNYFTWDNSPALATNSTSITMFGTLTNDLSITLYGSDVLEGFTAQQGLLNSLVAEFGLPKQEMDLYTPLSYDTLALAFLDRVTVDYPAVTMPDGTVSYTFVETPTNPYKIEGISIDPSTDLICFSIRRI